MEVGVEVEVERAGHGRNPQGEKETEKQALCVLYPLNPQEQSMPCVQGSTEEGGEEEGGDGAEEKNKEKGHNQGGGKTEDKSRVI